MAKLTQAERKGFEMILKQDLMAIHKTFMNQIRQFWDTARQEIIKRRGWDKLKKEKEKLYDKREKIDQKIQDIADQMSEKPLTVKQATELGAEANGYGNYRGANFFGIEVDSEFEYDIVQFIKKHMNLEVPAKILKDVCESSLRSLTMAGTFEEARRSYENFYSLDFQKYGVDIPPRIEEIMENKDNLLIMKQTLESTQIEHKK